MFDKQQKEWYSAFYEKHKVKSIYQSNGRGESNRKAIAHLVCVHNPDRLFKRRIPL